MTARFLLILLTSLVPSGLLPSKEPTYPEEFQQLFDAALDYYGKLQRTPNGLYLDFFQVDESTPPAELCSSAATGVGLMALCMEHELGRDPGAEEKALQTLRAINGKTEGFKLGREKAGFHTHFFFADDRDAKSYHSTIDTSILVAGALYCRNTFSNPEIKAEADELWNSIQWEVALANPEGTQLYMIVEDGKPRESSITHLFSEYYLLAWFIREHQLQKTGKSKVVTIKDLNTWNNDGLELLCANGKWPQCSFLIQFPYYMCQPCTTDPAYRDFVTAQGKADQRACSKRVGVDEFWGCGAGGMPGGGYKANKYSSNEENVVSPHIIAGFMPTYPLAREHLLKLFRNPERRIKSSVGYLMPRFSINYLDWRAPRIEAIDYSSMLFGLAGIHPSLGMEFFEQKTRFTFNQHP